MLGFIAAVVLCQFKVGDAVIVQPGGTLHKYIFDAADRANGVTVPRFFGEVIALTDVAGEQIVRIESPEYDPPMWVLSKRVKMLDEKTANEIKAGIDAEREMQRLAQEARRELAKPPSPAVAELERRRIEELDKQEAKEREVAAEKVKADEDRKKYLDKIARIKPYAQSESEKEALEHVARWGWDPLELKPEQANMLSPSQRKAISGIKARYLKIRQPKGKAR